MKDRPKRQRRAPSKYEAITSSQHARLLRDQLGLSFRYRNTVPVTQRVCELNIHSNTPYIKWDGSGSIVKEVSDTTTWLRICPSTLTELCNEAVRRKTIKKRPSAKVYKCPLSEDFLKARLAVDDLLRGWMVFDEESGKLQAFIMITHFTTWVKGEEIIWEKSPYYVEKKEVLELAEELNKCERRGNPMERGCIWRRVAEVSAIGALGGGCQILQAILKLMKSGDVRNSFHEKFQYVVLHATKNAIPFYERIGFLRIHCRARHYKELTEGVFRNELGPWLPYRHFEYTAESVEPSYMMVLKLETFETNSNMKMKWCWLSENAKWPNKIVRRYFRHRVQQESLMDNALEPKKPEPMKTRNKGRKIARALTDSPQFQPKARFKENSEAKSNILVDMNNNFCTRCKFGGTLILCDTCPRSYHLDCLKRQTVPPGKWSCPFCRRRKTRGDDAIDIKNIINRKLRKRKRVSRSPSHQTFSNDCPQSKVARLG